MEETILTENQNHAWKAKNLSKGAMVFATFWIIIMSILKSVFNLAISVDEILKVGITIVIIWSPTYISIYLDKWVGSKAL